MEVSNARPKSFFEKNLVKYGLIGGVVAILIMVILYLVDEKLLANQMVGLISPIVLMAIGVFAAVAQRRDNGGYISYGEAVGTSIGSFMIALVISTLFSFLLYMVIDTSLLGMIREAQVEQMDAMLDKGNMSQEQYDQSIRYIEEMGTGMMIFGWSMAVIVAGVIALIVFLISSIFVRREPQF